MFDKLLSQPSLKLWWKYAAVAVVIGAAVLRMVGLDRWPPSLYWEEVALGYDAYSLAVTGRDHHGHLWPVVAFESFGDYKPSGYFYAILPFLPVFGLSAWSVRLPSALAGVLIVVGMMRIAWVLASDLIGDVKRHSWKQQLFMVLTGALAAVSIWLVLFSRAGWEVNLATCFVVWAVAIGVGLWPKQTAAVPKTAPLGWLAVMVLLVASMYTYHATRLTAPILGLCLGFGWWWRQSILVQQPVWRRKFWASISKRQWAVWTGTVIVAIVLAWPLLQASQTPAIKQRLAQTSLFTQVDVITESNRRKAESPGIVSRILYHRSLLYSREIAKQWLSHWNGSFLFLRGDANARHSLRYFGQLYHIDVIAFLVGSFVLIKKRNPGSWLVLAWWWVSLVPAALTMGAPHALRVLPGVPALLIGLTLGWWQIFNWLYQIAPGGNLQRWRLRVLILIITFVVGMYSVEVGMAARFYTAVYPVLYSEDWQTGYREMVAALEQARKIYPEERIWLTREHGRPLMNYWFYTQTDPRKVQAAELTEKHDESEFVSYEKFKIINTVDEVTGAGLIASSQAGYEREVTRGKVTELATIRDRRGEIIWVVYRYQPN